MGETQNFLKPNWITKKKTHTKKTRQLKSTDPSYKFTYVGCEGCKRYGRFKK